MLDPAANLKICDFKSGDIDTKAFMGKATGSATGKNNKKKEGEQDRTEKKRAPSLHDVSAEMQTFPGPSQASLVSHLPSRLR